MFVKKVALKNEVLRCFRETGCDCLTRISNEFQAVLKEYKNEEKIQAIDSLLKLYARENNDLRLAFKEFDDLCAKESAVFLDALDHETSQHIEILKKHIIETEYMLKNLVGKVAEGKNEKILLDAAKIKLFDDLFEVVNIDYNLPEYAYYIDMELNPGAEIEKAYLIKPILLLHKYLHF